MANDSAMVLLLLVGVMFTSPSHSAHVAHNPYFKPYFYENPGAYQQPRILTFDLNDYSSIRMRTTTSVTSTTLTFTTTATCTRSTNVACVTDAPATTNRAPFLAGFARSLKEARVELSEPFQVARYAAVINDNIHNMSDLNSV